MGLNSLKFRIAILLMGMIIPFGFAYATTSTLNVTLTIPTTSTGTPPAGGGGGGGGGEDVTPPQILNVIVVPSQYSARIYWSTNELADSQVLYGLSAAYGSSNVSSTLKTSHVIVLEDLTSETLYHFKIISTDGRGNAGSTGDLTFTTLPEDLSPPNVNNLRLVPSSTYFRVSWEKPEIGDFDRVLVLRKIGGPSATPDDGVKVYEGSEESFLDSDVVRGITYFYTAYTFDLGQNHSAGVSVSGRLLDPEIPREICTNGVDDDSNGKTDCADNACLGLDICKPPEEKDEICSNGIDDDQNGKIDCADQACVIFPACIITPPPTTTTSTPGGETPSEIKLEDFQFFTGNRSIQLYPKNGEVSTLSKAVFTVVLAASKLSVQPNSITLIINNSENHSLIRDGNSYYADFLFPSPGKHNAYFLLNYESNQAEVISVVLNSLPFGQVYSGDKPLEGVALVLFDESGKQISTENFGYSNPLFTASGGYYGWVVPNGKYYIEAAKDNFFTRKTPKFRVENNVVNIPLYLIPLPPPITLDPGKIKEQIDIGMQRGEEELKDFTAAFREFVDDPLVQEIFSTVVAPSVVGVMAVATFSLISLANLIPLLHLLFLQPFTFFGRRKREGWGQVYNSLNKIPVDLATVRLINADSGLVIQSRVTDNKGRYAFMVGPGSYRLAVNKNNFIFPSEFLAGVKDDGQKLDVYHGEVINVSKDGGMITANIPVDPVGDFEKPQRLFWQQLIRRGQLVLAGSGIITTLISLYISPVWYMWILLLIHLALFGIFLRLAVPPKVKSWGVVYDIRSKKPVNRVVARLFNVQFNKLVASQITDPWGRYYFLAGDNEYFVTYDHPQYYHEQSNVIDLKGHEPGTITLDIGLNHTSDAPPKEEEPAEEPQTLEINK